MRNRPNQRPCSIPGSTPNCKGQTH
jgi:hypothetical protein